MCTKEIVTMEGIVKKYFFNKGYGFITSDNAGNHPEDYFFHISEVKDGTKMVLHTPVYFDIQKTPKGMCAVNIFSKSKQTYDSNYTQNFNSFDSDDEINIDDFEEYFEEYNEDDFDSNFEEDYRNTFNEDNANHYASIFRRQEQPQYPTDLTNAITNLLYKNSVPYNTAGIIATSVSNTLMGILNIGNSAITSKTQLKLGVLKELNSTYHISLDFLLQYLEQRELLATTQKQLCFDFYEKYCADMSFSEKMQFQKAEHSYNIAESTLQKVLESGTILGVAAMAFKTVKTVLPAFSKAYQKTEQTRIKASKKHNK